MISNVQDFRDKISSELKDKTFEELYVHYYDLNLAPIYTQKTCELPFIEAQPPRNILKLDLAEDFEESLLPYLSEGIDGFYLKIPSQFDFNWNFIGQGVFFEHIELILETSNIDAIRWFQSQKPEVLILGQNYQVLPQSQNFYRQAKDIIEHALNSDEKEFGIALEATPHLLYDISKTRALTILVQQMLKAAHIDKSIKIFGTFNATLPEVEDKLIAQTFASIGFIHANIFAVICEGFDRESRKYSREISERIAKNIVAILIEESYLGIVQDPLHGSYLIDEMTFQIIQKIHKA
jgi:hypothetical protein